MKRKLLSLLLAVLLLTGCAAGTPQTAKQTRYEASFLELFDTVTTMVGYADSEEDFRETAQAIHDELLVYHQLYDIYNDYPGINNIKTICLDLTSDNIAAMMNGHLDFLVGQRPGLQGFLAVETLLKNIICGGHPEVENYMPLDIITRENIDYYKEYVVQNSTGGGGK